MQDHRTTREQLAGPRTLIAGIMCALLCITCLIGVACWTWAVGAW